MAPPIKPTTAKKPLTEKQKVAAQNKKSVEKRTKFVESGNWSAYIRENYPALVSVYETTPEVAQIIRDSYINDVPEAKRLQNIQQSTWYKNLGSGEYEYIAGTTTNDMAYSGKIASREALVRDSVRTNYASYNLSDDAIKQIAVDSLKYGMGQAQIDESIGKAVTSGQTQAVTAPGGVAISPEFATVTASSESLKAKAKSFGLNLTDGIIQSYLDGLNSKTYTSEQVDNLFRQQAKSLYPSVAGQLDSGTLNDATSSYRGIAAQTLGIDSDMVDFTDAKFKPLLTYKDPGSGESRLMNATEWETHLRGLPEWQKTAAASQTYDKMLSSIQSLFGKAR